MKFPLRHQLLWAVMLILAMLGFNWAAAQQIKGPEEPVSEHRLVRLEVENVEGASWLVLPAGRVDLVEVEGGRQLVFTGPPGLYTVVAAVSVEGRPMILVHEITIAGESSGKEPSSPSVTPGPCQEEDGTQRLRAAAQSYGEAVPRALTEAAEAILAGKIVTTNEAVELVARKREEARGPYGKALDELTRGLVDDAGRILDPKRYASILREAASAMGGQP